MSLSKLNFYVPKLKKGKKIVLVSDAGYPGIDDPDFQLSRSVARGVFCVLVLDPSAAITVTTGFTAHPFSFSGFHQRAQSCVWKTFGKVATIRRFR